MEKKEKRRSHSILLLFCQFGHPWFPYFRQLGIVLCDYNQKFVRCPNVFFLPDLYIQMWQIQGMWGITEPPFWAVTWYESLPAAGKRLAWDFLPYGRTLTVVMYAAWSLKWERVDKVLTKSSLQSLQDKLVIKKRTFYQMLTDTWPTSIWALGQPRHLPPDSPLQSDN